MSVNNAMIMGRLGSDPELKYTPSGAAVCGFSVATSESYNDKKTNERVEKTEWHRIVVWGKLAELCNQYLSKGRQCLIEGSIHTRSWDDKDGKKMYTTEIKAKNVQFIGGDSQPSQNQSGGDAISRIKKEFDISTEPSFATDDIPF